MYNKLLIVLVMATSLSACKKNGNKQACGTQMCDASFAYLGVIFNNNKGEAAGVKNLTVINLRTGKAVKMPTYPPNVDFIAGSFLIASDENKGEFSTQGDDIKITATSALTGQIKTTTLKISGGCNCHVQKISGSEKVTFD